jgi:hypothetical protein
LESGDAENRTVAITQKRSNTLLSATLRPIQQVRCVSFYYGRGCLEQRPRGAGGVVLVAPKPTGPGPPKAPPGGGRKKRPPQNL